MLDIVLLTFVAAMYLLLMSVVLSSNRHARINQVLAALLFTTAVWIVIVFLEDVINSLDQLEYLVRLDYALGSALLGLFYWFCSLLAGIKSRLLNKLFIGLVGVSIILALSGTMTEAVQEGGEIFSRVNALPFGVLVTLVTLSLSISSILVGVRFRASRGLDRTQIAWVGIGLIVTVAIVSFSLVVLPRAFDVSSSAVTKAGIYSTLAFAFFSTYAIVRHKFLDIRQAAARTTAYAFLLACLTAVYVTIVFAGLSFFLGDEAVSTSQYVLFTSAAILIAFIQQPLTQIFNQLTDKIFFRRSYRTQEVLTEMGDITAKNNSLDQLALATIRLLDRAFRPSFTALYMPYQKDHHDEYYRVLGKSPNITEMRDIVKKYTSRSQRGGSSERRIVNTNSDETLMLSLEVSGKIFGYIMLGEKKQGVYYDKKDKQLLTTMSDELSLAVENNLRFQQIIDLNNTLRERVIEATKELRTSNSKLRQIDASKDEFISMASHQLRTPLTSIKGYISMLLDGDLGELKPEQRKALEEAYDSSQRMVYLIGDFLNLSRIQTGRFELERAEVSLPLLLDQEIEQLRQSAKARHVTLLYDEPADFPIVSIDETKIRQVMMNFIDNAIYYAKPSGGEVLIVLEAHRDEIIFRVKDNGIGVPPLARKRLFTKFYRADNARKARPDGTGIGLYMAKRVVVAHGGQIIFESEEEKGSEFGFRLPLAPRSR